MPGRWTAAAYTCLMVALYVAEPAIVTLTVHDHVRLDRVTGTSAERHGDLIPPGTTAVRLAAGTYLFRTTGDAQVQLGQDTPVHVLAVTQPNDKDGGPIELLEAQALPAAKGDSPPDHVPTLTVLRCPAPPAPRCWHPGATDGGGAERRGGHAGDSEPHRTGTLSHRAGQTRVSRRNGPGERGGRPAVGGGEGVFEGVIVVSSGVLRARSPGQTAGPFGPMILDPVRG